jgi:hypothetical protein
VTTRGDAHVSSSIQRGQQPRVVTIDVTQLVTGTKRNCRSTERHPTTQPAIRPVTKTGKPASQPVCESLESPAAFAGFHSHWSGSLWISPAINGRRTE